MAFSELLQYVGNFGRFQIIMSIMIVSAITFITTCNLVENFTAAIPAHRCYVHLLDNVTSDIKLTMNLTAEALLRISIPMGANQKQDQCRRFRQTQWQLLNSSNLTINNTELETEPCLDGWIYDQSVFTSTIVTQWDLVCDSQSLKPLSQFLFIVGYIIGSPTGGYFADKFSAVFFLYGLLLDLQNLGSNMFLSLALLGAVDYPTKFLSFFVMRFLKRRPSVAFTLFTAGCSTLVNVFVPKDIPFLRLGSAIFGKGLIAIFFSMSTNYFHELVPTGVRSTVQGLITLCNGLAAALTSLILITRQYFEYLPMILCGIFPIVASFSVYSLPETLNLPLPDTMDDMKRR
ncbi:Solute carrier family 22 member 12 [Tupaia chinensis]|uniref:Solute carrier family 22 member 12 n=1 Tax=Tupaia chinensis TaxID=246437 RepID=L9JFF3_TUPCH|nr:Solute carrier family 22 member 12 [Tupaia chinensis]